MAHQLPQLVINMLQEKDAEIERLTDDLADMDRYITEVVAERDEARREAELFRDWMRPHSSGGPLPWEVES